MQKFGSNEKSGVCGALMTVLTITASPFHLIGLTIQQRHNSRTLTIMMQLALFEVTTMQKTEKPG